MPRFMPQPLKIGSVYYYRKVVPAPLRDNVGKREIKIPLSKNAAEAKALYATAAAQADAILDAARRPVSALTFRQIRGLAGEHYKATVAAHEENPRDAVGDTEEAGWQAAAGLIEDALQTEAATTRRKRLEAKVGKAVDAALVLRQLRIDPDVRLRLLEEFARAEYQACITLDKRAGGNYGADSFEAKFPTYGSVAQPAQPKGAGPTWETIFEGWKDEQKPTAKTASEWRAKASRLFKELGTDHPAMLSDSAAVEWKAGQLKAGKLSAVTIKNYLEIGRTLCKWAVANKKLGSNPFAGVVVGGTKKTASKRLGYSDADARRVLVASREFDGARRWVPWLLAYTGARFEEVCQPLASDIRKQDGVWILDINAEGEGKSLKNEGAARLVPLHPELVAEGFIDYVNARKGKGRLFPELAQDTHGKWSSATSKWYGRWCRLELGITDKRLVAHSWRHRFKTKCREAGLQTEIHDHLTGHVPANVGGSYGGAPALPVLAKMIASVRPGLVK